MRILRTMLKQTCVYWAPTEITGEGQRLFASPVEVKCRWEDVIASFIDRMGNPQQSKARVYVGVDVAPLGVLWLPPVSIKLTAGAALAQLESEDDPFLNLNAYEIRQFERLPTLKQRNTRDVLRTVWM